MEEKNEDYCIRDEKRLRTVQEEIARYDAVINYFKNNQGVVMVGGNLTYLAKIREVHFRALNLESRIKRGIAFKETLRGGR
jgi:hypothetical protein